MRKNYVASLVIPFGGLKMLFFALLCMLFACQEDESLEDQTEKLEGWDIRLNHKGEYLEFENYEVFQKTINALREMDPQQAEVWSAQYGLFSLKAVYNQAVAEQRAYVENLEEEIKSGILLEEDVTEIYAPFVKKHARAFVFDEEMKGVFDMNIFHPDIANVVNEVGIVKIGNVLSQYTNNAVKVMEGGSASQVNLLFKTQNNNNNLNIKVNLLKSAQNKFQQENQSNAKNIYLNMTCSSTATSSPFCRGTRIRSGLTFYEYEDASGEPRITGVASTKHYFNGAFGWNLNIAKYGYVTVEGRTSVYEFRNGALLYEDRICFAKKSSDGDPSLSYTFYDGRGKYITTPISKHTADSGTPDYCDIPLTCFIDPGNQGAGYLCN